MPRWVWCIIVCEENVKLVVLRLKIKKYINCNF